MRLALGWAGIRRRAVWVQAMIARFLIRSASKFSFTRNARQLPLPMTPRRDRLKPL